MDKESGVTMFPRIRGSVAFVGTLLLLSATLAASKLSETRREGSLVVPLDQIDREIRGYRATENPALNGGELHALNPTSYLSRTYRKGNSTVDLFVAFYGQQRAGESMHSPKHCLPGAGWEIWDHASLDVPVGDQTYSVNKYSISKDGERMVVLYWYQSKGRIVASEYYGKLLLAKDALLRNETSGSIVRIIVPDRPGTTDEARDLASQIIPMLQHSFGG